MSPLGLNRDDVNDSGQSFRNGQPVTLPINFGNPVIPPVDFGNPIPSSGTNENTVDWAPSPSHFGNLLAPPAPPVQPTPTFSPVGGTYLGTQSVAIISAGADAIYYTNDGSTPTTGSALYSGPVSVSTSQTLKALAVRAGYTNSAIGVAVYTITPAGPVFIAQAQATVSHSPSTPAIDTTGATLLIAVSRANGTVGAITDSATNSWTYGTNISDGSSSCQIRVGFVSLPNTSATHTFTVSGNESSIEVFAFSGNAGGWVFDSQAGGFEGATPFMLAPFLASAAGVILTGCGSNQSIASGTIDEGFSTPLMQNITGSDELGGASYLIQDTPAPVGPTWTLSGNVDWIAVIAAFISA